ncbi:hypothetical protein PYW08_008991 [Mythimna loreyi]|uniref:Uncharacterized protein n=1 Tax=Mythimna loreyi TaxID=667449 RepID=A0ACC2Q9Y9_9NEOP|nr:hypothetical protein PYW08_008991 [Mythimna loreyi]
MIRGLFSLCTMEVKPTLVLIALTLMVNMVIADFFYNHPTINEEDVDGTRYKCVPGRTIVKVSEVKQPVIAEEETDSEEYRLRKGPSRRHHMKLPAKDETCKVCVCSAEGRDEYCSNRPADSINECLYLSDITSKFSMALPYEHANDLANRIRRDYIWHNDEIPYSSKAKCFRGHSYYTNSLTANDTDIDVGSDVESLLDYPNDNICYYCVCSTSGAEVGCINREVSFCNFYRVIRSDKTIRDRYTSLMEQDRPAYFRQLSYRMRRTMDNGIYEMLAAVNTVGDVQTKRKCVPFISEYTNCNEDNTCSGCSRCTCNSDAQWVCQDVHECPQDNVSPDTGLRQDGDIFDNALEMLEYNMRKKKKYVPVLSSPRVPAPQMRAKADKDDILAEFHKMQELDESFFAHPTLTRYRRSTVGKNNKHSKRSVNKSIHTTNEVSQNNTVKAVGIDELNEDTLKDSNLTGTLVAKKIDVIPPLIGSRRSGFADISSKALQIEYSQPKTFSQITDNKIETTEQENKFDSSHENLKTVLGNYTQNTKNKDLSKIVVNELKKGSETIGDVHAPPVSNITFTPENDTLTAMAFIAGNLLNKLWNMEKDADASSTETDGLKHEKIADLLELFKEPLNLRQEIFLKNALEQLSSAIDKHKDAKNVSICETINEAEKLYNADSANDTETTTRLPCRKKATKDVIEPKKVKVEMESNQREATIQAIAKINNVVELIKKFEHIQGKLSELHDGPKLVFNHTDVELTEDEKNSFNMFGNVLEKITKLILPKRNSKKITNVIKTQNFLKGDDNLKKKFEKLYNVDLTNMTVSAKDKLILDYLTHIDGNPDCLLKNKNYQIEAVPSVEGNILLNLSEFFKLKSFSDLIKLIEPEKTNTRESPNEKEKPTVETSMKEMGEKETTPSFKGVDSYKFNSTKEKLKAHLKTIMEDLIEIQSAKGVSFKGNFKVSDALPCIYNLLKSDTEIIVKKEENIDPVKKIASIFQGLKKELKASASRRNTGNLLTERPKSAVVWERLVTNLANKAPINRRRSLKSKIPKSYEDIKKMMDRIENGSSTYKHRALLDKTPATGKLILLKALEQEAKSVMNVIDEMKLSFESLANLPRDKFTELDEFVTNMQSSIRVSEKVNDKVKSDQTKIVTEMITSNKIFQEKKNSNFRASNPRVESDEMKINRIQIVNQLIRNRIEKFIKLKEASGSDVKNDMIYNIAKRILFYLDIGNYKLANELFRFFVMQKQNEPTKDKYFVSSTPRLMEQPMRRMEQPMKKAPVLLEDPKEVKAKHMTWATQDHLIKQLLNIKNMGL